MVAFDHLAGGGYSAAVVDRLLERRDAGEADFGRAWQRTIAELPAPWSWTRRYERLQPSALDFLRQRCEREWNGEGGGARLERPPVDKG